MYVHVTARLSPYQVNVLILKIRGGEEEVRLWVTIISNWHEECKSARARCGGTHFLALKYQISYPRACGQYYRLHSLVDSLGDISRCDRHGYR